jgi:hypothetical protein
VPCVGRVTIEYVSGLPFASRQYMCTALGTPPVAVYPLTVEHAGIPVKFTVTVVSAFIVTEHGLVPVQPAPLHPRNLDSTSAAAPRVSAVPGG